MRCVFDTNVLDSPLHLPDSKPRQALDLGHRKGKVLLSFAALAELYEVLSRKQFRRYVDIALREKLPECSAKVRQMASHVKGFE